METDLFWDIPGGGPEIRPSAAHHSGPSIEQRRDNTYIRELECRLDKLSMICCAMWTVLQAQTGQTDEDLMKLVQELDLCDGRIDGKARLEQVHTCSACNRPVATRHIRCLYCGAEQRRENPFEDVL